MNPPLRGAGDIEALRAGLADGTIDIVGTDHAPHAAAAKRPPSRPPSRACWAWNKRWPR